MKDVVRDAAISEVIDMIDSLSIPDSEIGLSVEAHARLTSNINMFDAFLAKTFWHTM